MRERMAGSRAGERGFSLIEVLISLGLLAGVMVSVCSMFILGGTFVKSGKQLTQATAMAQDIMEDINKQAYTGLYLFVQDASPDPNAVTAVSDTRVASSVADDNWGTGIRSRLHKGYALITMKPLGGTATPSTFASGEAIRVTVELGWTELRRNRAMKIEHVRF